MPFSTNFGGHGDGVLAPVGESSAGDGEDVGDEVDAEGSGKHEFTMTVPLVRRVFPGRKKQTPPDHYPHRMRQLKPRLQSASWTMPLIVHGAPVVRLNVAANVITVVIQPSEGCLSYRLITCLPHAMACLRGVTGNRLRR